MPREAIQLGDPEILPSGKVRWRKSFKKYPWRSSAYNSDSRRNRSLAWAEFVEWREDYLDQLEAEQKQRDEEHPLRKNLVEHLQEEIALAGITNNRKQANWASDVLAIVRKTDEKGLYESAELLGIPLPGEVNTEFSAARNVVQTVIKNKKTEKAEHQTRELIKQWLVFRVSDVKAGDITAGAMNNQRMQLERFAEFCPNILTADGMKFLEFRATLQAGELAKRTQRDTLTTVKGFLEWCADTAMVIDPIPNLRKRGNSIKVPTKKVITIWKDEDIHDLFETVTDTKRLYYLLMLNTGAYESDLGTWTRLSVDDKGNEFETLDFKAKTITFKRHKEKDEPNVPTVTYRLWDETFELMQKHQSTHPELLLTTSVNTVLWKDELNEKTGRRKTKRMIGKQYRELRKKLKKENWGTLDDLRKTSISKFDEHEGEYARYSQHFAGHSPEGTTDRFYRKPSQTQFDKAVIWLGEQFGFKSS
ncbi:hypothetical protein OAG75_00020 [bacterium]|nr:hypothetical protein [bacterium]